MLPYMVSVGADLVECNGLLNVYMLRIGLDTVLDAWVGSIDVLYTKPCHNEFLRV